MINDVIGKCRDFFRNLCYWCPISVVTNRLFKKVNNSWCHIALYKRNYDRLCFHKYNPLAERKIQSYKPMTLWEQACLRKKWNKKAFPLSWWRHQMSHFPRYCPFVRDRDRPPHKGQWRGPLMFSLICVWSNSWANNGDAGDMKRRRAHWDITAMSTQNLITDSQIWNLTLGRIYAFLYC